MDQTQLLANRYNIRSVLGEGGMGTVYRVADGLQGNREIALKTIKHAGDITEEQRLRFKEEFRAMARLKHPNTIEVLDFGQLDASSLYITMALVEGRELADVLAGRALPLSEVYTLLIQLLHALAFIHARQYVHRDIKSQNLRVRPDGTLVLMDFGLMCQGGTQSTRTVTGTPGYLAPEVAVGGTIDASTDLYAVGCLAYEMLTGKLPFSGTLIEVIRAHISTPPPSPRELRPEIPERLERLVMRLLEKDRTRRYGRAALVLEDLAAVAGVVLARENQDQRRSYLVASALVGREKEVALLGEALAEAGAGRGVAVMIGAPAGTGKSRLLQELTLAAKLGGFYVLSAAAEDAGAAPYDAIARALRPALALDNNSLRDLHQEALSHLFPELAPGIAPPPMTPLAVAESIAAWLAGISAAGPLLIALDDLHWSDASSMALFNHCARHLSTRPIMCVGGFRNDEAAPGHALWYTVDEGTSRLLALGPLSPEGQLELVCAMLQDVQLNEDFAQALYLATGGNAFFLTEVLRALMDDNLLVQREGRWHFLADPAALATLGTIEATLTRRLTHLSPEAYALLGVAAVIGRHQELGTLLAVAGLTEDRLFEQLDELVERQFLIKDEAGFAFPHDRVREVRYSEIPASVRRALHLGAGEFLESRHAGDPGWVQELARHFERGGDAPRAHLYLRLAGDAARAAGAPAVALDLWHRADEILPVLPGQADAERQALWWIMGATGFEIRPDIASAALERLILALGEAGGRRAVEARAFLAVSYGFGGRPDKGKQVALEAVRHVPADDAPLAAAVLLARGPALFAAGAIDDMVRVASEAAVILVPLDPSQHGALVAATRVAAISYALAIAHQGATPAAGTLEQALAAAGEAGTVNLFFTIRHYLALGAALRGDPATVESYLEWGAAQCRKRGAPPHPWLLYLRPHLSWLRGELAEALLQLEKAVSLPHMQLSAPAIHFARALRGRVMLELGQTDASAEAFAGLEAESREHGLGRALTESLLGKGDVALARGQGLLARAAFEEAWGLAATGTARNPLLEIHAVRGRGSAALLLGDLPAARRDMTAALARASRPDLANPLERARTLLAIAELERESKDPMAAGKALQEAGDLYQSLRNQHGLHTVVRAVEALKGPVVKRDTGTMSPNLEARWQILRGGMN